MWGLSWVLWLFLVLCIVFGGMEVWWCVILDLEQQKCSNMSKVFWEVGIQFFFFCVQGILFDYCIQFIVVQEVDVIILDGGVIYEVGKEYGLKFVVGEVYD